MDAPAWDRGPRTHERTAAADELNRLRQHLRRIVVCRTRRTLRRRLAVWQLTRGENGTTAVRVRQGAGEDRGVPLPTSSPDATMLLRFLLIFSPPTPVSRAPAGWTDSNTMPARDLRKSYLQSQLIAAGPSKQQEDAIRDDASRLIPRDASPPESGKGDIFRRFFRYGACKIGRLVQTEELMGSRKASVCSEMNGVRMSVFVDLMFPVPDRDHDRSRLLHTRRSVTLPCVHDARSVDPRPGDGLRAICRERTVAAGPDAIPTLSGLVVDDIPRCCPSSCKESRECEIGTQRLSASLNSTINVELTHLLRSQDAQRLSAVNHMGVTPGRTVNENPHSPKDHEVAYLKSVDKSGVRLPFCVWRNMLASKEVYPRRRTWH